MKHLTPKRQKDPKKTPKKKLAFTGMSNKALIDFQTRHTFSVKIALGFVFLALAAVILFGARML